MVDDGLGLAVLAERGLVDVGAEGVGHGLEAIADAEHGDARLEQLLVDARGAGLEHGGGAAREDDRLRILGQHLVDGHRMGHEFGIDVGLTDAAGDELGVLGAEVDDEHRTCCHGCSPNVYRDVT